MQFLSSPTYPRPLILSEQGLYDREDQQPKPQTVLRHNKQIAIGRWNSEEHQWFLKGLEMFQGPAWGEIARLIGTRTSTQVRTHAQKFFTKMARLNQTMPYFEVQIQKERARLVAQGANVTPTAQSTSNAPLSATLSPRKRLASTSNSPRQSLRRFKEEAAKSPTYGIAVQARRYPQDAPDMKPRVYTSGISSSSSPSSGPVMTKEWPQQQWVADDARQWPLASPTSTAASLQLTQLQLADVGQPTTPTATADAESLPSMNKLLCRSTST
ncbi:Protein REVEILLE 1 [Phytophthora citrophthora]|uniref:Protein REVEILLE 1 n=1 Tax=Phytophthora citrophthora TaxID=4793 RepID=A0AAD9G944_9STRA|nr:Protein REVEILLE 1 [Phytophthora citrophthora]